MEDCPKLLRKHVTLSHCINANLYHDDKISTSLVESGLVKTRIGRTRQRASLPFFRQAPHADGNAPHTDGFSSPKHVCWASMYSNPAMEYIYEGETDFPWEIAKRNVSGFRFVFPATFLL